MQESDGKVLIQQTKRQILTVVLQNYKNSAIKHSRENPLLLSFVGFFTIFWL